MKKTFFMIVSTILIGIISLGLVNHNEIIISDINKDNYEIENLMLQKQYIDRKYKILKYPSFLSGAKLIMTANDDKSSKGADFLIFTANKDVSVYVAHWSEIKHTPSWLKEDFSKTDLIINSGETDYILYKRDFPAGRISLGGNIESEEEDHAMYSVIVSEQIAIPEKIEYINNDYKSLLTKYQKYNTYDTSFSLKFIYQNPNDIVLKNLREQLQLDKIIADQDDEITQIVELMKWVNKRIEHNGSNPLKTAKSLDIINEYDNTGKGVNCNAISIVLNDIYLALGFKARIVKCLPHEDYDTENHVTNLVFSKTLNKWIFMDPSFSAYVINKNGMFLDHSEIREALISGDKLIVKGGLIHNGELYAGGQDSYLNKYMSKNLFRFSSPLISSYNAFSESEQINIFLNPRGYKETQIDYYYKTKNNANRFDFYIQDDKIFWNNPVDNE